MTAFTAPARAALSALGDTKRRRIRSGAAPLAMDLAAAIAPVLMRRHLVAEARLEQQALMDRALAAACRDLVRAVEKFEAACGGPHEAFRRRALGRAAEALRALAKKQGRW